MLENKFILDKTRAEEIHVIISARVFFEKKVIINKTIRQGLGNNVLTYKRQTRGRARGPIHKSL